MAATLPPQPTNGYRSMDSAQGGVAVTPSDSTEMTYYSRGIMCGVSGNIAVEMLNDSGAWATLVLPNVVAGVIHPIVCRKIRSTSTTATSIVVFW